MNRYSCQWGIGQKVITPLQITFPSYSNKLFTTQIVLSTWQTTIQWTTQQLSLMLTHWLALSRFYPCKARRPVHRLGVLLKLPLYMTVAHCTGHLQSTSKYLTDLTRSQGDKVRSITGGLALLTKVFFLIITFSGVSKVRSMTSLFPWL